MLEVMYLLVWPARLERRGCGYTPSVGVLFQREWMGDESSMRTAGMRGDDNMSQI